jgi:AcrR family transcriptional regulator
VDSPEQGAGESEGLQKLPPGRHGLSRDFVTRNQRDRLAAGIIASVSELGYHATTISGIAAAAGVSRRTFYSYFSSKEECFLAAFALIEDHLVEAMRESGEGEKRWPDRVRVQLAAMVGAFQENPNLVRFTLIAPPAAGGEFLERYRAFLEQVVAVIVEGRPASRIRQPSEAAEFAMAGGLAALLVARVNAGEGDNLIEALPELVELVLTPYIGRERARNAARGG